ncbi:hypothetical protein [Demequina muriae]|uniref:Uncharacterized protein n=1 Tax=Demequina muriae TaxID=3051664 RepID=A0ABT8GI29_9MICO|nr:hypothetical protein [Demequina sp. EGI L300058]MDN4480921.1 hypothetical protein [Demequina sp. EGI L300058]
MKWWGLAGAVALVVLVAALAVPIRSGGTEIADVSEVAAEEGVCGQLTSTGRLVVERMVPLIDLGLVATLDAAVMSPAFVIEATDACGDVDGLGGGVMLSHPRCEVPNAMSADESQAFVDATSEPGSDLVVLCEGAAFAMVWNAADTGGLEFVASWSDHRYALGRELAFNQPNWCLDTGYWVEATRATGQESSVEARSLEPVASTWCIDLVAP